MDDSSASESADDDGETRGTKRAHGGKYGPELEEKPHKSARKLDTVSPGQSRKEDGSAKEESSGAWAVGDPTRKGTRKPLLEQRGKGQTAPQVPKLNFEATRLSGLTPHPSSPSSTPGTSTPLVVTTLTLPASARSNAETRSSSPRTVAASDSENADASRSRAESPRHSSSQPRARPKSPRTLTISVSSAMTGQEQTSKAAPPTPGRGRNASGGMPASGAQSASTTLAEQLGFNLDGLPGAQPKPSPARAAAPESQRGPQIDQAVLDDLDQLLDKAINAHPFARSQGTGARKEQEKGPH